MYATLLIVAALVPAAPGIKGKPNPAEQLVGLWELERSEGAGNQKKRDGKLYYRFNKDGTWDVLEGDKPVVGARPFKFDPKAGTATVDLGAGNDGREMAQGIYKIEGDKLTICKRPPTKGRPTEFATPEGSPNYLMIFRRVKE